MKSLTDQIGTPEIKTTIASVLQRSDRPTLDRLIARLYFGVRELGRCNGMIYEQDPRAENPEVGRLAKGKNVVAIGRGPERDHYGSHRCSLCGAFADRHVLAGIHIIPPPRYSFDMQAAWSLRLRLAELGWNSDEEIVRQGVGGELDYHFLFRPQTVDTSTLVGAAVLVQYGLNGRLASAALIIAKSALKLYSEQFADNPPAPPAPSEE